MMIAPVLGMKAMRSPISRQTEQQVVGDAEAVEDDVPAVGAHHHARQQRRERQRDQHALPAAARAHQEIRERVAEQHGEQADARADDEGAHERPLYRWISRTGIHSFRA
jgi:hypothetical protein